MSESSSSSSKSVASSSSSSSAILESEDESSLSRTQTPVTPSPNPVVSTQKTKENTKKIPVRANLTAAVTIKNAKESGHKKPTRSISPSSASGSSSSSSADIDSISEDSQETTSSSSSASGKGSVPNAIKKPTAPVSKISIKRDGSRSDNHSKTSTRTPSGRGSAPTASGSESGSAGSASSSASSAVSGSSSRSTASVSSSSSSSSSSVDVGVQKGAKAGAAGGAGKFVPALNIKTQKLTVRQPVQYNTPRGPSYNTPRGPRFNGTGAGVRVKVISESSSSDANDKKNKISESSSESGSENDSDGERLIKDDENEDVEVNADGKPKAEVVVKGRKHSSSASSSGDDDDDDEDDSSDSGTYSESESDSDSDDDDSSDDESESESEGEEGEDGKKKRKRSLTGGIELSRTKKKSKGSASDDDEGDDADDGNKQKPHKHKPGHKTDVVPGMKGGDDDDDDDEDEEGDGEDGDKKKKKKKKKRSSSRGGKKRRKGGKRRRKGKRKKKKSLKKRFIKLLKRPIKYARSSIQCTTITFFIAMFAVAVVVMALMAWHMAKSFRDNDFRVCDNDVDRISHTIRNDLNKLSDILEQFSKWGSTARAVDRLAAGDPSLFNAWYEDNFLMDGGWMETIGYNLLAIYSLNHTCLYSEYHPSKGFTQMTQERGEVPSLFNGNASLYFHELELADGNRTGNYTGERCQVMVSKGSSLPMLVCHHTIIVPTSRVNPNPRGYMIMAVDLVPRLLDYCEEISACVSIWSNASSANPTTQKVLRTLAPGGITANGQWGGATYHQSYALKDLEKEGGEAGITRVCSNVTQFEDTGKNVASFFIFPNSFPGHRAAPLMRVDHPAAMEDFGRMPIIVLSTTTILFLIIFIVVILVYLDLTVLKRISSLSAFLAGLSNDPNNERQDIPEPRKFDNDPDTKASASSKSSGRSAPGAESAGRRSQSSRVSAGASASASAEEKDVDSDASDETSSDSTSTSTSTSATSTSTSATSTTTSASTTSSRVSSVASSESTVTGATTGTSATSGSSTGATTTTTTSTESGESTGEEGSSSGGRRGNDEIGRLQKAMRSNVDTLKEDITTANLEIRKEHRWRRRHMHALRLMNMWCGRKDIFPGLRGKDKPVGNLTTSTAGGGPHSGISGISGGHSGTGGGGGFNLEDEDHGGVSGSAAHSQLTARSSAAAGDNTDGLRGYEDMSVDDMLARPIAVEFLKVHSRFEDSQENIFFLLDVTWLQELEKLEEIESDPVKKAQMHDTVVSVADHIVKRYIAKGSPQEINISAESMAIVRKLSGTYSKNMFAKAVYDVKMMTSMDVLSRFKHTPAFLAMSEALDVETYDMMSSAASAARKSREAQRKNAAAAAAAAANAAGGSAISAGEIQVSAPGSERSSVDLRSDAFGDSDDEEDDINDFDDDDEDTDDNNAAKIDKPFRSTFRLMNAIADGTYRPNTGFVGASHFSTEAESMGSDSESTQSMGSNTPRSPIGPAALMSPRSPRGGSGASPQVSPRGPGMMSPRSPRGAKVTAYAFKDSGSDKPLISNSEPLDGQQAQQKSGEAKKKKKKSGKKK